RIERLRVSLPFDPVLRPFPGHKLVRGRGRAFKYPAASHRDPHLRIVGIVALDLQDIVVDVEPVLRRREGELHLLERSRKISRQGERRSTAHYPERRVVTTQEAHRLYLQGRLVGVVPDPELFLTALPTGSVIEADDHSVEVGLAVGEAARIARCK